MRLACDLDSQSDLLYLSTEQAFEDRSSLRAMAASGGALNYVAHFMEGFGTIMPHSAEEKANENAVRNLGNGIQTHMHVLDSLW